MSDTKYIQWFKLGFISHVIRLNSGTGLIAKGKYCEGKLKRFLKRERFFQDCVKRPRGWRGLGQGRGAQPSPHRALCGGKASAAHRPRLSGARSGAEHREVAGFELWQVGRM